MNPVQKILGKDVSKDKKDLYSELKELAKDKNNYYAKKMLKEYEQVAKKRGHEEAEAEIRYNYSDFFNK